MTQLRSRLLRHGLATSFAVALSSVSLVSLAYLSEYTQPSKAEPVAEHSRIVVAELPKKREKQQSRPAPMKTAAPIQGPDIPALDLPSMIQAPSLRPRESSSSASLARPALAQDHALTAGADMVVSEELVDDPPRAIVNPAPRYPSSAQRKAIEGKVSMRVLVDRQGNVMQVVVTDSEPAGVFDDAAVDAMRRWRFSPASFKGQPVQVSIRKTLSFRLE